MALDERIKEVRKLQLRAVRGDRAAQTALYSYNNKIAREVNKRMRALERRGYDFGAYNAVEEYAMAKYNTNRFQTSDKLDYYEMRNQTEIGLKFMSRITSTVEGNKAVEEKRFKTFADMGIVDIDDDYSRRRFRNFLKFVSNEESKNVIESWSGSDTMIQVLFDAYNRKENTKNKMLGLFREFLDPNNQEVGIEELFTRLGLNMSAYRKTRFKDE